MFTFPLKLKNDIIEGYWMDTNTNVYSDKAKKILRPFNNKEGRPVVALSIGKKKLAIRLDYLVLSTLGTYHDDIIHLIHIDDNDANCQLDNLMEVRKIDIIEKYKDMYHVEKLDDIEEIWKNHPSYPSIEVSNLGQIRFVDSKEPVKTYDDHGYTSFRIHNKLEFVHRSVALAFVNNPNPSKYEFVNHIDGNKQNNAFWNLEWCDIKMNTEHMHFTGLDKKYTEEQVRNACRLLAEGLPHTKISVITGLPRKYISDIYRGRRQKQISSEYSINRKLSRDDLYNKEVVISLIKTDHKPKQIAELLKIPYDGKFISYYESLKRAI